jgi:mono/diheme cytochrome c family protein
MTKTAHVVLCTFFLIAAGLASRDSGIEAAPQETNGGPTFTRDVAPILYANCVTCHRPGEIARMSLLCFFFLFFC